MNNTNKTITDKDLEKRQQAQVAKQSLIETIIENTEEFTAKQLAKKNKKKEDEIVELLGGSKISISQIKGIIANSILNPFIAVGVRANYHYQWLTPESKGQAEKFIDDAVKMMQTCNTWYEFRKKYAKAYGVQCQLSLWE